MSSLITVVGRAGLNRNVFRSQEDILSRSKVFFCPSTWLEGVDQKASSEVAILEINCDNMVRLTKCMSGSRKLFLSIYSPQKYKNGMKLADLLKNSNVVDRYDVHLGLRMQIERAVCGLQTPTIVYRSQCKGTTSAR